MRCRGGIGVGIVIALLAIGATLIRSHGSVPTRSCGSAASTPVAFVEITSFAQIVQSRLGAGDPDQNLEVLRRATGRIATSVATVQVAEQAAAISGPLYKRPPPPSFS
jgi:hypothetical protein